LLKKEETIAVVAAAVNPKITIRQSYSIGKRSGGWRRTSLNHQ
jgi:hypothetical protein